MKLEISASTQSLLQNNVYSWLHTIEVHRAGVEETVWLSKGITVSFIQQSCSQLSSLSLDEYDLDITSQSFLRSLVPMIPFSLPTNTSHLNEPRFGILWICTDWSGPTGAKFSQPHSVTIQITEEDAVHQNSRARVVTKTWLERDECGDTMRYSVSNQLAESQQSMKLSIQRVLIRTSCSFADSPLLCHKNFPDYQPSSPLLQLIPALDGLHGSTFLNDNLRTIAASLTVGLSMTHLEFQTDREQEDKWVNEQCDILVSDSSNSNDKEVLNDRPSMYGLLDQLFGGEGRKQNFLEESFQQTPTFSESSASDLVTGLSLERMLDDYRRQDKLGLVSIRHCKIEDRPDLDNMSVALSLVSDFNCTILFRFEQLSSEHLLTDLQAQLESELLCPVTAHVYVSAPTFNALPIHTDPYDVFVVQLQGRKLWKICLPREMASDADSSGRKCVSQADRALEREMLGWFGMGGTNFAPHELHLMDCEYVELLPGDTLYLPRSFVHVAEATSIEASVHITFGLQENGRRWKDVLLVAIESVAGFSHDKVVGLLSNAINEISRQNLGKNLNLTRYKWNQAFPMWKCSGLKGRRTATSHGRTSLDRHDCQQQFVHFENLLLELDEYVRVSQRPMENGYLLHAMRHHLRQTRTMEIFIKVISHMLEDVVHDLSRVMKKKQTNVEFTLPQEYAWAQRALEYESQQSGSTLERFAEVATHSEERQRRSRRDSMFGIIDQDTSGFISMEEMHRFISKFAIELEAGLPGMFRDFPRQQISRASFLEMSPIFMRSFTAVLPTNVSASIQGRFAVRSHDTMQKQQDSLISNGILNPAGRHLLSSSRSLLAVDSGDPLAENIGDCDDSCDSSCDSGCDRSCDLLGCDSSCDRSCDRECDASCDSFSCRAGAWMHQSGCTQCPANSHSVSGSTASTSCTCNQVQDACVLLDICMLPFRTNIPCRCRNSL